MESSEVRRHLRELLERARRAGSDRRQKADEASREALEMPAPVIVVTTAAGSEHAMALGAAGVLAVGCLVSGGVLLLRRRRA